MLKRKVFWMKMILFLLCGLTFALVFMPQSDAMEWSAIRDGSLYLRADRAETLQVRWNAAWQAEANREQIYLLKGDGSLQEQLDIHADKTQGEHDFALKPDGADYRLGIPGYSFRNYRVRHDDAIAAQFEPAKVHFSVDAPRDAELYFRVAANKSAILNGKHHGGVSALQATRLSDATTVRLNLQSHARYGAFDRVSLPVSRQDEIWRLKLEGQGKAAFWLDGVANLFAQKAEHLHPLRQTPGHVTLRLKENVLGPTPKLGVALPYAMLPEAVLDSLEILKPQAATFYSFGDALARNPGREVPLRRLYVERFGIKHDITLLANTERRAVLTADPQTLNGINIWLADRIKQNSGGRHYLAFADEPNLNYPDYASFSRYCDALLAWTARETQKIQAARAAGVRIAEPASSRFLDGPFHDDAARRRGIDWARDLLKKYDKNIDAVAWHEWMTRDLFATRRYRDNVLAAAQLVGRDVDGRPRKALLIGQTNISSGSSISPYQQEGQFAALWWASVVINAAQDGLLDMLNWFPAIDDAGHPKGMMRENGALRPVGLAQAFIRRHWLPQVEALDNDAFEVDALAMRDVGRRSLIGVNKSVRVQQVRLENASELCRDNAGARLELFGPDQRVRVTTLNCSGAHPELRLPGQTLFALVWRKT
ncbi:MAG: hypothetical protein LBQ81_01435 [Zoogloeaceae bacterium]|jgi:hypothetical protein|nr:hypothetical protein [Zoogloeaceae bacterium]